MQFRAFLLTSEKVMDVLGTKFWKVENSTQEIALSFNLTTLANNSHL